MEKGKQDRTEQYRKKNPQNSAKKRAQKGGDPKQAATKSVNILLFGSLSQPVSQEYGGGVCQPIAGYHGQLVNAADNSKGS